MSCSNHYPCHVKESFFVFSGGFGGNYRWPEVYIYPLPVIQYGRWQVSSPPHGNRCPCLVAVYRRPSTVVKGIYAKSIVILHKKQCFIKCLFRVYPICTLRIARYRIRFLVITTYSVFTVIVPVFPFLEAPVLLCASPRSAGLSDVVHRIVARLVLGRSLPCHRRP